ncbi:hypothetical protein GCM10029976_008860 [Kribbella albertanoniae]|uniref:DUF8129 domain-containing protein n=1 Tax=Kribbella albertanoniae TaxID=1266829 RepID=A0A4R4Q5M7_9ACTN|nr:hypothetical protein [Kribbella albertanoniae]TDC30202.1 hypothetical protein E1261_14010 [Kribbella albertanoniae]
MVQNKAALPLPEFDRLPVGSLAERIRALDTQQLDQLIGHERNHGQRIQILALLQQRRDQLKSSDTNRPEVARTPDNGGAPWDP